MDELLYNILRGDPAPYSRECQDTSFFYLDSYLFFCSCIRITECRGVKAFCASDSCKTTLRSQSRRTKVLIEGQQRSRGEDYHAETLAYHSYQLIHSEHHAAGHIQQLLQVLGRFPHFQKALINACSYLGRS